MSTHVLWKTKGVDNACVLDRLCGVDRDFELVYGVSRAHDWPQDATYTLDPDFPRHLLQVDNYNNTDRLIVVSVRLKEFLERKSIPCVEYLPVQMINHKKKPHANVFITHLIEPVDCLRVDQCGAQFSKLNPSKINDVEQLVVDEARIPAERLLFRPANFSRVIFCHRELANEIDAAGFTGVRWLEIDAYPED